LPRAWRRPHHTRWTLQLDLIANDIFTAAVANSGRTSITVSEEEDNPIAVEVTAGGAYIVAFDPIDGSSNLVGAGEPSAAAAGAGGGGRCGAAGGPERKRRGTRGAK
jgi:fructose-1,6-bisphosphatase I